MSVRVMRAGMQTTVQDRGRRAQQFGVVRGGAMDIRAARIGNLLVGNDADAALLEATLTGPVLRFDADAVVAICGADMKPHIDGAALPMWRAVDVRAGTTLELGAARSGCRTYVAVGGGFDVPRVLGSRATDVNAGFGGFDGRALQAGDVLHVGSAPAARFRGRAAGPSMTRYIRAAPTVRFIDGPEHEQFTQSSRQELVSATYQVSAQSSRMGYRLDGPVLQLAEPREMISSPVVMGTVQVPPSGAPIVLMADGQTIGGYPRIASVISADIPLLAQLPPGGTLRFSRVTVEQAQQLYLEAESDMRMLQLGLELNG